MAQIQPQLAADAASTGVDPADAGDANRLWLATGTLWKREIVRFFRQPFRVIGAVATPLIFWALLGSGFNRSFVMAGTDNHVGYLEYFSPGRSSWSSCSRRFSPRSPSSKTAGKAFSRRSWSLRFRAWRSSLARSSAARRSRPCRAFCSCWRGRSSPIIFRALSGWPGRLRSCLSRPWA